MATTQKSSVSRLSVNINADTVGILSKYKAQGQSATETVRQALASYDYFKKEIEAGRRIQTVDKNGEQRTDVVFT
jgi:hypothetical protein